MVQKKPPPPKLKAVVEALSAEPARKRGRPRQYDPAEALLRARDVFWIKGYSATSLDDLVEATGMNRPSLYAAFGDKHALYIAALKMQGDLLVKAVTGAAALDMKLKPFLELFFQRSIESYLAGAKGPRGCFLMGTALTEALSSEEIGANVRDSFGQVEVVLEKRLKQAQKAGELPAASDPRALAILMSSAMHELSMLARAHAPLAALQERAKLIIRLIVA